MNQSLKSLSKMKILYLYSELMPYQLVVFKELVKNYSAEIVAIHWDKKKLTPSVLIEMDSVTYIPRSNFNTKKEILSFVEEVKPD
ncbi:MAG: hypothetical protein LBE13_04595, partial [Bacteroidales bacterium]|nr:hypothetical protein [Bacteroidales bacterium]